MSAAASPYPTLYEALRAVRPSGHNTKAQISVVDDIKPAALIRIEGLHTLSPEQLLNVRIPLQRIEDDEIRGYQRHLTAQKARDFARFLQDHRANYDRILPVIEISLSGSQMFYTDGQHRGAGAIIARLPYRAVITKRTEAEARMLFALQAKALRPSKNVIIFNSDGRIEEYIQDAVTDDTHPWSKLITAAHSGTSKTKMSATSAIALIRIFAAKSMSNNGTPTEQEQQRFKKSDADALAVLISAFGSKQTNPYAYKTTALRAIAIVGRRLFIDRESHPDDLNRWIRHMNRFPFAQYAYISKYNDLAEKMAEHWNKHLAEARRLSR
jgi:hypothetical protein